MNYQRISTYEKDYEAASSFDLGSSFTTSKCLNACHTISLARSMNGRDVEDACEVMTKTIGIENEMALVLAYLATPDVFTHSTDSITKRYGWDKEKVEQVLFELHKQDLINQLPELESIFLSNKAITMLQNDISIEYIK